MIGNEQLNIEGRPAHGLILQSEATRSGLPEDKLAAIEAIGNIEDSGLKGLLGRGALAVFRARTGKELRPGQPESLPKVHEHTEFTDNEVYARAMQAVSEVAGSALGVTVKVEKPDEYSGYLSAAQRCRSDHTKEIADYNAKNGSYVIDVTASHDTGSFYRSVDAIREPHAPVESQVKEA